MADDDYVRKPRRVKAWFWDGSKESLKAAPGWVVGSTDWALNHLRACTQGRSYIVNKNTWLIKAGETSDLHPCTLEVFRNQYEKLKDEVR